MLQGGLADTQTWSLFQGESNVEVRAKINNSSISCWYVCDITDLIQLITVI